MASSVQNNRASPSGYCMCCRVCNNVCWRAFKWIPVLLIVSIITWSYYAYVIQLCLFTIESTVQQVFYLIFYHILLFMFAWSYCRTIFAEIRPIPEKYKLPEDEIERLLSAENEEAQRQILENFAKDLPVVTRIKLVLRKLCIKENTLTKKDIIDRVGNSIPVLTSAVSETDHKRVQKSIYIQARSSNSHIDTAHGHGISNDPSYVRTMSGSVRYCNRCVLVKPDRAHHCSLCGRCVLKMDHHCPWVNNCVCFHNYKFFMLFLGYALVYCTFLMATCLPYFIKFWKQGEFGSVANAGRYHIVFAFFVALMFGISLGSLFGYHCYLVATNRTTLEAFRAPMFRGGVDQHGFSIGAYNNFKEVFGSHPPMWLLPVFTSLGDGCDFPVRREHQLQTFTTPQESYDSMGTTRSSFGDGIVYPLPIPEEDTESLLSAERWDRWGGRARPFDERESSSFDEL